MARGLTNLPEANGVSATRRFVVPIAIVMLLVGAAMVAVILYSARKMDENIVSRDTELVDNSINGGLTRTLRDMRSVAWWDEAVTKSRGTTFDAAWLDLEVGAFMTESFHHNRILILDEQNRPVYGYNGEGRITADRMRADLAAVAPLVQQIRGGRNVSPRITDASYTEGATEGTTERRYGRSAAAVVQVNGQGELAAVMAITPSVDMSLQSPRPRLLVSFIKLDAAFWRATGREFLLPDLGYGGPSGERRGDYLLVIGAFARRLFSASRAIEAREARAQHLANHDSLTGLPNRRKLETEFVRFTEAAARDGETLAVACVDVDRFKDINDTLGHHAGDQLIRSLADRLRGAVREGDFISRLGGDEFAVMRNCRDAGDGETLLANIRDCFRSPFRVVGHLIEANASAGVAFAEPGLSFDDLMREADIALYEAKASGRGCDVRYEAEMGAKVEKRRMLEVDLKGAIADGELSILYQPIVEASTGQIASVEALCRWNSPRHGFVPPDVFIPIAEEAGLMADLGRFVIDRAVSDSLRWPNLHTAINVSAAQLRAVSVLEDLIGPTEKYGVSPERITIEITETVLLSNDGHTSRMLQTLKDCGFALALDDFGTGYSSLAYIRDFPFDRLKIDRSFVHGLKNSERALAIIEAVANFGRILGKDVVAEGIETEPEMQAMQKAGCTHLQGYLFARPLPAEKIAAMVALGRLTAIRNNEPVVDAESKVARRAITPRRGRGGKAA